jgi:predicted RNA methylase
MKLWQLEEQLQAVKPFTEAKTQLEQVCFMFFSIYLSQYITTPHLAAHAIYTAAGNDDIEGKYVLDLGTGTGMLAIACALMGAAYVCYSTFVLKFYQGRNVIGIDIDPDALTVAQDNISNCEVQDRIDLLQIDVQSFEDLVKTRLDAKVEQKIDELEEPKKKRKFKRLFDTVVLNPPFGTRIKGADMQFLKIASELTNNTVYSLHKSSTREVRLLKSSTN